MRKVLSQLTYIVVLIIFITTSLFAVTADDINDMEDDREAILDAIELSEEQLAEMEAQIEEINQRIIELDTAIYELDLIIAEYETQLDIKQNEIEITIDELAGVEQEEVQYYEQVTERIQIMYEYGESSYLEILLEAENIGDFFNRLEYLSKVFVYDENMFERLELIQQEIASKEAQLEIEEQDLENLRVEATNQKESQQEIIISKNIEMETVQANQEMLLVQKALWEEEEEQLEADIKEAIRLANELKFADGEFIWPAPSCYTISSPFGLRIHPITGVSKMHNGIDIPASGGSDVIAAAAGKVIASYYNNSYGNLVVVNHGTYDGSTYVTYYAHNSVRLVSEGDPVAAGEVIAKVGSTGYSTGNHLHFGVLKDGAWVNPLDYFEKY